MPDHRSHMSQVPGTSVNAGIGVLLGRLAYFRLYVELFPSTTLLICRSVRFSANARFVLLLLLLVDACCWGASTSTGLDWQLKVKVFCLSPLTFSLVEAGVELWLTGCCLFETGKESVGLCRSQYETSAGSRLPTGVSVGLMPGRCCPNYGD